MAEPPNVSEVQNEMTTFSRKNNDPCDYHGVILKNGLRCMLVHDPDAHVSSVSLSVSVGNYRNPVNYPGLAHLVEHMLIFQSIDCPEAKFFKYVGKYAGTCNAETDYEDMCYFYNVPSAHLEDSIQQFYKLFSLDPQTSFTDQMLEYELSALDSEFRETMNSSDQRRLRIQQLAGEKGHALTRFYKGNNEELQLDEDLLTNCVAFAKSHIVVPNMTLAIVSNYSTNDVKKWLINSFSNIQSSSAIQYPSSGLDMFNFTDTIPETIAVCQDGPDKFYRLELMVYGCWDNDNKEGDLLVDLLNRRGRGSLLENLKNKLNFDSPTTGASVREYSSICFGLTRIEPYSDEQKWTAVVMFFQYVESLKDLIKRDRVDSIANIYNQMCLMNTIKLHYGDCRGLELAKSLNSDLSRVNDKFISNFVCNTTNQVPTFNETIKGKLVNLLNKMDIKRTLLIEKINNEPSEIQLSRDKIYNLHYRKVSTQSHAQLSEKFKIDSPSFEMPTSSPFVPDLSQMDGYSNNSAANRALTKSFNMVELPFGDLMHINMRVPSIKLGILFRSRPSGVTITANQHIMLKLYITDFMNANLSLFDHAKSANIETNFEVDPIGIQLTISGFKHQLDSFVQALMNRFCGHSNANRTNDEFTHSKNEYLHEVKHTGLSINEEIRLRMRVALGLVKLIDSDMCQSVSSMSFARVAAVFKQFLSGCTIKLFVTGYTDAGDCAHLRQLCEQELRVVIPSWSSVAQINFVTPEVQLDEGSSTEYCESSLDWPTHAYLVYHQIITKRVHHYALMVLLKALFEPEFVGWFRFSQVHPPVGYASSLYAFLSSHSIGLMMVIQPDIHHGIDGCSDKMNQLIGNFLATLNALSDLALDTMKNCLVSSINEQIESDAFNYYWSMVKCSELIDTTNLIVSIRSIRKEQLIDFYQSYFVESSEHSRRLVLQFRASKLARATASTDQERAQEGVIRVNNLKTFLATKLNLTT